MAFGEQEDRKNKETRNGSETIQKPRFPKVGWYYCGQSFVTDIYVNAPALSCIEGVTYIPAVWLRINRQLRNVKYIYSIEAVLTQTNLKTSYVSTHPRTQGAKSTSTTADCLSFGVLSNISRG